MSQYVVAPDQGTTSSRCILFNKKGKICSVAQKEFKRFFPQPGWVEHDPMEIWSTQLAVTTEAMSKIGAHYSDIAAIGITNQRETNTLGAAYLAGLAVGYWKEKAEIRENGKAEREFAGEWPEDKRTQRIKGWKRAVRCALAWAEDED